MVAILLVFKLLLFQNSLMYILVLKAQSAC